MDKGMITVLPTFEKKRKDKPSKEKQQQLSRAEGLQQLHLEKPLL